MPFLRRTLSASVRLAAVLLPALLVAVPVEGKNELRRSLAASPAGRVEVELYDGSVRVTGWDRDEVEVTASLSRPEDGIDLQRSGNAIELEIESRDPGSSRAVVAVKVPRGSSVRIEVLSAAVEVSGVTGEIDIEAVAGDIKISGRPRKVRAHGVTGGIDISTSGSEVVEVESVSGNVTVDAESREVDADTVAGTLRLKLRGVVNGRFEAVSGSIDAEIVPAPRSHFDFESFSGTTTVAVPAGLSARFELESAAGRIESKLAGARERRGEDRVEIEQGSGDAVFRIESFSGSIEIKPLGKPP